METINILFVLASVMENVIINEKNPEYKHLAKAQFNKITKEVKRLNKITEKTLSNKQLESFDDATNQIVERINKIIENARKL